MNNAIIGFKRFLTNKNTVTIILILVGVGILYFGYTSRVNAAIEPIKVPYAKKTIQPRTEITEDMIGYMSVPKNMVKAGVVRNSKDLIGRYADINALIPSGSLFYEDGIVFQKELPNSYIFDYKDGYSVFNLPVNVVNSYGILPDDYIDIYFKAIGDDGKPMVGKMVENVKVSVVIDKNGKAVYENTEENRVASTFIFAVPEDIHLLLRKASYLSTYKVELFPVPSNQVFEDDSADVAEITSTFIKEFIEEKTINVPVDELPTTPPVELPDLPDVVE